MDIVIAIIVLGVLVFVHELGHFLVAKWANVYVEKFSIGFGPVLLSKKYGETEYVLSALPLGGYVKMYGEQNDDEPGKETYDPAKEGRSFRDKSAWYKAAIIIAGPLFNVIFAIIIFWALYMSGIPSFQAVVGEVEKGSVAEMAGLKTGDTIISVNNEKVRSWNAGFLKDDKIISINGEKITSWSNSATYIRGNPDKELLVEVERAGKIIELKVTPKPNKQVIDGKEQTIGLIGIAPIDGNATVHYGPIAAMGMGLEKSYELTKMIYIGFAKLIKQEIPSDSLGGPILIVQTAAQSADSGFSTLLIFMAAISINLAVFNLLPIPVLDGGQLAIITAEGVMGRPLGEKALGAFQMFGLVIILSLMVFAFYNDIMRLIR